MGDMADEYTQQGFENHNAMPHYETCSGSLLHPHPKHRYNMNEGGCDICDDMRRGRR